MSFQTHKNDIIFLIKHKFSLIRVCREEDYCNIKYTVSDTVVTSGSLLCPSQAINKSIQVRFPSANKYALSANSLETILNLRNESILHLQLRLLCIYTLLYRTKTYKT